jgi:tyrosyl-tRNA synthetase
MHKMTLSEELTWRGFVNQTTYKDMSSLDGQPITFYWGVDPSADSMQIGNLAAAMLVKCFIKHGHKAILLVGGATGMIGDPDGKAQERNLKSSDEIAANKAKIANQYKQVFDGQPFETVDNYDWFKDMNYLDFLRDTGKHVPLRTMLARDFVSSRLGEDGSGISYAEFSYVLIQAYDFLHLHREHGVNLQLCGADQWGNSVAGVDLIRRITGDEAQVFSAPLIVNKATGVKFGKSEAGAVWLDADKTSPNDFYQFWINVDDAGVEDYLKVYTELDKPSIEATMQEFNTNKAGRAAQKKLAYEVTKLVHGQEAAESAVQNAEQLSTTTTTTVMPAAASAKVGDSIVDLLVESGLSQSKSEARQLLADNGIYINDQPVQREQLETDDFRDGKLILRKGKKLQNSRLIELVKD